VRLTGAAHRFGDLSLATDAISHNAARLDKSWCSTRAALRIDAMAHNKNAADMEKLQLAELEGHQAAWAGGAMEKCPYAESDPDPRARVAWTAGYRRALAQMAKGGG
jgi:ribosome modulation factor